MSFLLGPIKKYYSQTRAVQQRKDEGKHPINEMQRFRLLCSSLFCSVCVSLVYAFDLFTPQFSNRFDLSAGNQSTISTVGVVFCYFALPYGILYDYMGPTALFGIAFITSLIGCLGLALIFSGNIVGNTTNIAVFYAIMNVASGLLDSAAIVTLVETFPRNRGPVVGLSKVMTGLGSSVLASVSSNLFTNDISGFIYFILAISCTASLIAMVLITLPPYFVNGWRRRNKAPEDLAELQALKPLYHTKQAPKRRLVVGYILVITMLIFFTVSTPVTAYTPVSPAGRRAIGSLTLILCVALIVIALPIKWLGGVDEPAPEEGGSEADAQSSHSLEWLPDQAVMRAKAAQADTPSDGSIHDDLIASELQAGVPSASADKPAVTQPGAQEEQVQGPTPAAANYEEDVPQDPRYGGTLWDNLLSPDIWLILIAFVFQGAIGMMVMYNASTIYVARTGKKRSQGVSALYTAFLGVGSAVGRIAMGLFEAYVQQQDPNKKHRLLVTVVIPLAPTIAVVGGILVLVLPGEALLFPYILIYLEEGFFNGTRALLFPCIFQNHHGIFYNMSFLSTVVCAICFNRLLFGFTVDSQHNKLGFAAGEDCKDRRCVQTPLIVATVLAAVAAVLLVIVHIRYARFVRRHGGKPVFTSETDFDSPEPINTDTSNAAVYERLSA